jgi:hypothetical protein
MHTHHHGSGTISVTVTVTVTPEPCVMNRKPTPFRCWLRFNFLDESHSGLTDQLKIESQNKS